MEHDMREKVIKGLECCTTQGFGCIENKNCPYGVQRYGGYCVDSMLRDAIALLKAQEPRVMTVADIVDNYVTPEVIWVEARNNKGDIRLVAGLWNGEYYNMADDSVMYDLGEEIANNPEGYNTRWRCWTSCPTDEQREATPWN